MTEREPVRAIESVEQYEAYLAELAELMPRDPEATVPDGARLVALAKAIEEYERPRFNFDPPEHDEAAPPSTPPDGDLDDGTAEGRVESD